MPVRSGAVITYASKSNLAIETAPLVGSNNIDVAYVEASNNYGNTHKVSTGYSISVNFSSYVTIDHCVADNNGTQSNFQSYGSGICLFGVDSGLIQYCEARTVTENTLRRGFAPSEEVVEALG